jgi:hypothetical protein
MGPSPITYEAIEAWSRLTRNPIFPWEVDALKRIDRVWMQVQSEQMNKS